MHLEEAEDLEVQIRRRKSLNTHPEVDKEARVTTRVVPVKHLERHTKVQVEHMEQAVEDQFTTRKDLTMIRATAPSTPDQDHQIIPLLLPLPLHQENASTFGQIRTTGGNVKDQIQHWSLITDHLTADG